MTLAYPKLVFPLALASSRPSHSSGPPPACSQSLHRQPSIPRASGFAYHQDKSPILGESDEGVRWLGGRNTLAEHDTSVRGQV